MRFFVGRDRDNHVPLGNGRLLATLQQYGTQQVPMDRLCQLYYPTYDTVSPLLGSRGSSVIVRDPAEKIWYDPFDAIRTRPGQYGEHATIDQARFVDGTGIYQVLSHKGVNLVRTTTWIPREVDALVRRIEPGSLQRTPTDMQVFPVVHVKHVVRSDGGVVIAEVDGIFLALTCPEATEWHAGDVAMGLIDGFNNRIPSPWLLDERLRDKDLMLTFRADRSVPGRPAGTRSLDACWGDPVHLIVGVGRHEREALAHLDHVLAQPDRTYRATLDEHRAWLDSGARLESSDPELAYLWRTSLSLLRTSLQEDGSPIMVGFREYQGRVWVRDGIWIAVALARTGHLPESLAILRRLKRLLRTRPDGNFCFAYNCRTGEPAEHTYENDSTGLLIFGIATYWEASGDPTILAEFWELIAYCADWIVANLDETGLVRSCAGIWETFGPHLEREHEHMVWTSAVSAYGLLKAVAMGRAGGRTSHEERYETTAQALIARLYELAEGPAGQGPLPRSLETGHLDASVLTFFSWMPLFDPQSELASRTLEAIEDRLVDPCMGGVWRHEDLTTEWGDMRPWIGPTLWLAEAYLLRGDPVRAWQHLGWVDQNRSFCGLVPELMFAHDIPRGLAMPSYSQGGLPIALLRHFDLTTGGGVLPPHVDWMHLKNVPDGLGGRRDYRIERREGGDEGDLWAPLPEIPDDGH